MYQKTDIFNSILKLFFIGFAFFSLFLIHDFLSAAVGNIHPDGAGNTTQGTRVNCALATNWECISKGVSSTTVPSNAGVRFNRTQFDSYQMGTISNVDTVTEIQVFLYHVEGVASHVFEITLWNAAENAQIGGTLAIPNKLTTPEWGSVTFTGLSLTQAQLNDLRIRTTCARPSGGGNSTCTNYALYGHVTYTPVINITASVQGTQEDVLIGQNNQYVGASFAITENTSASLRNVNSITIHETGTVNASTNLKNIRLFYKYDTTSPYNCASESFTGSEAQYGTTVAGGFSGANGSATFTSGTVQISTTQALCLYVTADVQSGASPGETIEIQMNNPSVDIVASGSPVISPSTVLALPGTTNLLRHQLRQMHYHWRNDDGDEASATSATGGVENTPLAEAQQMEGARVRFAIVNKGNATSPSTQYRIEYAQKSTTCSAATGWTDVGASGGDWDMYDSTFLTNGENTTDIAIAIGGVPNENTSYLAVNGGVRDTNSQTGGIVLTSSEYVDLEYSIMPTGSATSGNVYCFRVTNAGTPIDAYDIYPEATIAADVYVGSTGAVKSSVDIPSSSVYAGGAFTIIDKSVGENVVTSFTLYAEGTADIPTDITDLKLFYKYDITSPYNCASESYTGSEAQYGSTLSGGFNVSNYATFTGSATTSPTQAICFYVVYSVAESASNGETIGFYIDNPTQDIVLNSGTLSPNSRVSISGTTDLLSYELRQTGYHWRNAVGSETTATSYTGGVENTPALEVPKNDPIRLRLAVNNAGGTTSPAVQYRLEYAQKISVCSAATGWADISNPGDAWQMSPVAGLTDGADTTAGVSVATGGITDPNTNFLSPNGGQRDTTSQTGSLILTETQFVELEFAIAPTSDSVEGSTYCFRLIDGLTEEPLDGYDQYPEATIKLATDFFVQRGTAVITGTSVTLTAGVDYIAPSSASSAFMRITNSHHTGAGSSGANNNQNSTDVTAYIVNPGNIMTSVNIARQGTTNDTRVSWEIVEYQGVPGGDNEIIVRQQSTITYGTADVTATTGTVSGIVDDNDVAVFITGQFNPDAGRFDYNTGLSTAQWNTGPDTATFTRGEAGADAVIVSYAVIEFTGSNWRVARVEHTYTSTTDVETKPINPILGSVSRAFVHAQKRVGANLDTHAQFGHEVWISSSGQVSFRLDGDATTPASHISVAWVIENRQTSGNIMRVTQSNGAVSGGTAPLTTNVNIGRTLPDMTIASLFINNRSSGTGRTFPEPMLAATIISPTQYQLWMSKTTDTRTYRTEIVEWPTAAPIITQNYYQLYIDNDALTPTDPWPSDDLGELGENMEMTGLDSPMAINEHVRIRMTVEVSGSSMPPGLFAFKLQYAERASTCTAVSSQNWRNLGNVGSTTAIWRGAPVSVTDGTPLSTNPPTPGDLLITSVSTVAGTFEKENNSALAPYLALPGDNIEYDWAVQNNGANDKTSYCFRMVYADSTELSGYNFYPTVRTVGYGPISQNWRWYNDTQNETPSIPLANQNVAPIDVSFENDIALRLTIRESSGAQGNNIKFRLQFSESPTFATSTNVAEIDDCSSLSYWCYTDTVVDDDDLITTALLTDADTCVSSTGNGCGTHNESGTSTSTFTHQIGASTEFSFLIKNSGARVNRVYYFRVFDVTNDEVVPLASGASYPSLVTEGASVTFTMEGLTASTVVEGVTLDITTTPTTIPFGVMPIDTQVAGAHRLIMDTNGTEGYQIYMTMTSELIAYGGSEIEQVTGTNASPTSWNDGCLSTAPSCFGYHSSDDTLYGGSTRFSALDTWARISTTGLDEVGYSSQPAIADTVDVVFRLFVRKSQDAGQYEANIQYVSVPIF